MADWSRSEKISVAVLVVGILSGLGTWLTLPGIRSYVPSLLGLESAGDSAVREAVASGSDTGGPPGAPGGQGGPTQELPNQGSWSASGPAPGGGLQVQEPVILPGGETQHPNLQWASNTGSGETGRPESGSGSGDEGGQAGSGSGDEGGQTGSGSEEDSKGEAASKSDDETEGGSESEDEGAGSDEPVELRSEGNGGTGLAFEDGACRGVGDGVRCTVTVSNPGSSAVSVALARSYGSSADSKTYLSLPGGDRYAALRIEFGRFSAAGMSQLARAELEPGESLRADLIFGVAAEELAGAGLHLALIQEGKLSQVWLR